MTVQADHPAGHKTRAALLAAGASPGVALVFADLALRTAPLFWHDREGDEAAALFARLYRAATQAHEAT